VPNVPLTFYSFRIMVMLGGYFLALFAGLLLLGKYIMRWKWALLGIVLTTPLAWLASQAGWVVAEVGRQPWAIQGLLPNVAAISRLDVGSVQTTFFIFLGLFTLLLVAEVSIMARALAVGPETPNSAA
jgi:cytochrome d ubiquinol oxidase subunit I